MKFFTLNNGVKMPAIGLGTFPMKGFSLIKTFNQAVLDINGNEGGGILVLTRRPLMEMSAGWAGRKKFVLKKESNYLLQPS